LSVSIFACGVTLSRPVAWETGHACRDSFGQNEQLSSWRATLSRENGVDIDATITRGQWGYHPGP
jgi:hypothetical protein